MDYEEMDHYWREGYNAGYRRAVEFVKKSIENPDNIVEQMMKDWCSWSAG